MAMYQAQVVLFVRANTERECQDRLNELKKFAQSVKSEDFIPGFYDIDTVKPDQVRTIHQ